MAHLFATGGGGSISQYFTLPTTPDILILTAPGTYLVPAGKMILVISVLSAYNTNDFTLSIGTTPGGTEVVNQQNISQFTRYDISIVRTFDVDTTLYFSGIPGSTTFTIYKA